MEREGEGMYRTLTYYSLVELISPLFLNNKNVIFFMYMYYYFMYTCTVKPPNIGYLKIGTQYINLSTMNTLNGSNNLFCYHSNTFEPPRRGQPLYKGKHY